MNKEKKQTLANDPSKLSQEDYKEFKNNFFEKRDVSKCMEPVFSRVLGHDHFFPVYISKKVQKTNIEDKTDFNHPPLQLGNDIPQDVIPPCDERCQFHVLGHLYTGDMLSYQSADRLDQIRHTHGLGEVPDRFMTMNTLGKFVGSLNDIKYNEDSEEQSKEPDLFISEEISPSRSGAIDHDLAELSESPIPIIYSAAGQAASSHHVIMTAESSKLSTQSEKAAGKEEEDFPKIKRWPP